MRPSIGVLLHGATPPAEIAALARHVEESGFDEIWLSEDYFLLGGFTSAAIALQATNRLLKKGLAVGL